MFPADVHAIHEAIMGAHQCGLGGLVVYSDSRSALQALKSLVRNHKTAVKIKDLVKRTQIRTRLHWVRGHVGHIYNERADALFKAAMPRHSVDVVDKTTRRQDKK